MKIFTIGFTKHSAESFFEALERSGANRVIDVRLHNASQLAGFAKRDDLAYFLRRMPGMDYVHMLELAPTDDLLKTYRVDHDWGRYEQGFLSLMKERSIESMPRDIFSNACLLCSEHAAHHCHRRLVAEYLKAAWGDIDIVHL